MKRNCNGCKALTDNYCGFGHHCQFDHKIKMIKEVYGVPVSYKPLEECEKPRTYIELVKLSLNRKK